MAFDYPQPRDAEVTERRSILSCRLGEYQMEDSRWPAVNAEGGVKLGGRCDINEDAEIGA